jgi:hypothetical protein
MGKKNWKLMLSEGGDSFELYAKLKMILNNQNISQETFLKGSS